MQLRLYVKTSGVCVALMLACQCLAQVTPGARSPVEREDLRVAERAIVASLAVGASVAGKTLCRGNPIACVGPDRMELAISLIASRSTPSSLRALGRLVRFHLDGAYYEQYGEGVASKGAKIRPYLAELSPKDLRNSCHNDFVSFIRSNGSLFDDKVQEEEVCRTEQQIAKELRSLQQSGKRIEPE